VRGEWTHARLREKLLLCPGPEYRTDQVREKTHRMKLRPTLAGYLSAFVAVCVSLVVLPTSRAVAGAAAPPRADAAEAAVSRSATLPLRFEVNAGQTDARVRFVARGGGATAFITPTEAVFRYQAAPAAKRGSRDAGRASAEAEKSDSALRLRFVAAAADAEVSGEDELTGRSNYFVGADPARWRTDVRAYERVRVRDVYPGVDALYYGRDGQLEYDLVVAPGADLGRVRLAFDGADALRVDESGDLVLATPAGEVRQRRPALYQERDGAKTSVSGGYRVLGDGAVGLSAGGYDPSLPLVVDPVIVYAARLGSASADYANAVAVDSAGAAYVTGLAGALGFPTTAGVLSTAGGGNYDAFVAKLDPTGAALEYCSYVGGDYYDNATGVAVDSTGSAYVTGYTMSTDFPVVNAFKGALVDSGDYQAEDAFVAKLSPSGASLAYATYLGGARPDEAYAVAVDSAGSAYVTGYTLSTNFPTANALKPSISGAYDAFVTKLSPSGSSLAFSTYLGGGDFDAGNAVAVDAAGCAYVAGVYELIYDPSSQTVTPFPAVNAAQPGCAGASDAFVVKLAASGTSLVFATSLGGRGADDAYGVAVGADGAAYLAGVTDSSDFPAAGAAQPPPGGGQDAFLTKVSPSGAAFEYSTRLGGANRDAGDAVAVDGSGHAYLVGYTASPNFPTAAADDGALDGEADGFVARCAPDGSLEGSTFFGGAGAEFCGGAAVDATGALYFVAGTTSAGFPPTGVLTLGPNGGQDVVVVKRYAGNHGVAPNAPTGASASAPTANEVDVTWTDASANEAGFRIERRVGAGAWAQVGVVGAGATAFADVRVEASATYTYRVRSTTGLDDSTPSNEAPVATPGDSGVPAAPSGLLARAVSTTQVTVGWVDNSRNETGFEIERKTGAGGTWAPVGAVAPGIGAFADSVPAAPATYVYRVRATGAAGPSGYSNEAAATVDTTTPAAPTGLTVLPQRALVIGLQWTDTSANEAGFRVERRDGPAAPWVVVGSAGAGERSFYDSSVDVVTAYTYRVRAYNVAGESAPSNEVGGTFDYPHVPALQLSAAYSRQVSLTWDRQSGELYSVERKVGVGGEWAVVSSGTSVVGFVDTDVTPGTTYNYRIRSYYGQGGGNLYSGYSAEVAATTPNPSPGAVITVSSGADTNARDAQLTLREAVMVAEGALAPAALTAQERAFVAGTPATPGFDEIRFSIAPGGAQTIALATPLPTIADPVRIDGTSQPGYGGAPVVELLGTGVASAGADCLHVTATGCTIRALVIGGFPGDAIEVASAADATIANCYLGTTLAGTAARANGGDGLLLTDARYCTVTGNVLSGNAGQGLEIMGSNSIQNQVTGNMVGTNAAGTAAVGNANGVVVSNGANNNTFGGGSAAARNVISGNAGNGFSSTYPAAASRVNGNYIGTNASGAAAVANGGFGVAFNGFSNRVTLGNVISGNGAGGIKIYGPAPAFNNSVNGNLIGTNAAGTAAVGNLGPGIWIDNSASNLIGSTTADRRNVISGNSGPGVLLTGADCNYNVIRGNYIGTDATGTHAIGQGGDGVRIDGALSNSVGDGTAESRNTIAFNAGAGVAIPNGFSDGVNWNSFAANGGLPIDLGPTGGTPNDPGDGDSGANQLQNAPVISAAVFFGQTLEVTGTYNGVASSRFIVELYMDGGPAAGGSSLLGSLKVGTDANGDATFTVAYLATPPPGATISATATVYGASTASYQTSEFSNAAPVTGVPQPAETPGVYAASTGAFFLRYATAGGPADAVFTFGPAGAALVPLSGDWNADGVATPGLYDPATGAFFLKNTNAPGPADVVFTFGAGGQGFVPLAGDWDGDGRDTVGLYAPATGAFFLKNTNAPGPADLVFAFGPGGAGVVPVRGDWNGDGVETVGIYVQATGAFFLRNANAGGAADVVFAFGPGGAGVRPVSGDWNGDGRDTIGLYVTATGTWFLRNANAGGAADLAFSYGPPNVAPLAGHWSGQ
jgi:parallel beta-helix repeat protein